MSPPSKVTTSIILSKNSFLVSFPLRISLYILPSFTSIIIPEFDSITSCPSAPNNLEFGSIKVKVPIPDTVSFTNSAQFSGNVINDWKIVLTIIGNEQSEAYQNLLKDAKHLRLLQRGSQLYASLDELWRENGSYVGATEAVANALTQEHFSMSTRKWSGINIMTIHKSKGKEFDAVIIYEGRYQNRIISKPERREQAILNLRVAVTRAKEHTYILTPDDDPCSLL